MCINGAKHSPPALGPFGGSHGQLATLPKIGIKLTPLTETRTIMVPPIGHSRFKETRRGTWQSVLPYGVSGGRVFL